MKNHLAYRIALSTLSFICFNSCREMISDECIIYESSPVVNSILVQGQPVSFHLSMSGGIDSLKLPSIDQAVIELWVDGKFMEEVKDTGQGFYVSDVIAEPLKEYSCKVIIPGEDTIRCSQTLPEPTPILNAEHINIAGKDQEGTTYPAVRITFQNNSIQRRYYEITLYYFEEDYSTGMIIRSYADIHTITDQVILNEGLPIALFSNEIISDSIYTMTLNYTTNESSSQGGGPWHTVLHPLIIELRSITYDYYRYQKQYYLYNQGRSADGLLTTLTTSPLYSNIENGNGIFAGYSVFKSDTITPEPYEN